MIAIRRACNVCNQGLKGREQKICSDCWHNGMLRLYRLETTRTDLAKEIGVDLTTVSARFIAYFKTLDSVFRDIYEKNVMSRKEEHNRQPVFLCDESDKEYIGQFNWHKINGYLARNMPIGGGKYTTIRMHKQLWELYNGPIPTNKVLDHINGIKHDNRLENLRCVTHRENALNKKVHREGRLYGSYYHKSSGRWQAYISVNNRHVYIGRYDSEIEAHNAYENYRLEHGLA